MLRGKNLEYVVEGGFKEGYNGSSNLLPEATLKADNRLVSSIITSRVHEENFVTISPHQDSARRMWRALSASHQNNTAGGRYMHLRAMMTTRAENDDDVSKLIVTMDTLRQRLLNVSPDGTVSVDDLYVSSLISALPESWTSVTAPIELQATVSPSELKSVLRGHLIKLKNREASSSTLSSSALATSSSSRKPKHPSSAPRHECNYCKRKGHLADSCHRKLLDDQRKEIDALKQSIKTSKSSKSAKVAQLSDSDTDSSIDAIQTSKKTANSSCIRFSRLAKQTQVRHSSDDFIYNADTGCTDTLVKNGASLGSSSKIEPTPIYMADDTSIDAIAAGPIKPPIPIPAITGLVVPGLAENLLSIGQLADNGVTSIFKKDTVEFYKSPITVNGTKLGEGRRINRKYLVRPLTALSTSTSPASLLTWHLRLSHLGEASIRRLHHQGIITVTNWDRHGVESCVACKKGRMVRRRFGSRMKYKATRVLEVIHSDVCQLSHPSRDGHKYFVSFIDDYSKHSVVYQIKRKSEVFESFVHFVKQAERETGERIVDLRSDNGGEYVSHRMQEWCQARGIKQTMGPPHTPQLNGVAERYNRTLLDRLKPSLEHSTLHREFWSDAFSYAVWTTNRSPTRTNLGFKTPHEVYSGRLASMKNAHVFGAKGFYLVPSANRSKLESNSRPCIFLGVLPYDDGVKVLDVVTKSIVKTRDVYFGDEVTDLSPPEEPISSSKAQEALWMFPETSSPIDKAAEHQEMNDEPPPPEPPANHRPSRERRRPAWFGSPVAYSAALDNSPTYKVAMQSADSIAWREAMQSEIDGFIDRKVFTLVPKPANSKTISCRWHLKKKFNLDGTLKKFKARLVARGFTQREGIDYQETFAPSSRQESLKAYLAVNGF